MTYESTQIISRIGWCRLQQQLHSVTRDERAGWRAEEAGLVDALGCRDGASSSMLGADRSQITRYRLGLDDGQALLRLGTVAHPGTTTLEGWRPALLMTQVKIQRNSFPLPAPRPLPLELGR